MNPLGYLKAIAGGVLAGLGVAYMGLDDSVLTAQEWVGVAQSAIAAFATVWGLPNLPTRVSKHTQGTPPVV